MLLNESDLKLYVNILLKEEYNPPGEVKALTTQELQQLPGDGPHTSFLKKAAATLGLIVTLSSWNAAKKLDKESPNNFQKPAITQVINQSQKELPMPAFEKDPAAEIVFEKLSFENLKKEIKKSEGFKGYPYEDGNGLSVGYGTQFIYNTHKIPKNWKVILYKQNGIPLSELDGMSGEISEEIAEICFVKGYNNSIKNLRAKFKNFDDLPHLWKEVLIDLNYNVGDSFDKKFPKFTKYTRFFIDTKNNNEMIEYASKAYEELSVLKAPKYHFQQSGGRSGHIVDKKGNITYGSPEGKKPLDGPHRAERNFNKMGEMLAKLKIMLNINESKSLKSVYSHLYS